MEENGKSSFFIVPSTSPSCLVLLVEEEGRVTLTGQKGGLTEGMVTLSLGKEVKGRGRVTRNEGYMVTLSGEGGGGEGAQVVQWNPLSLNRQKQW